MQGAEDKVTVLETPLNPLEETALLNGEIHLPQRKALHSPESALP